MNINKQIRYVHQLWKRAYSVTSTVESSEMEKFKKMSINWWKSDECKLLLAMNKVRVPFIRDGIIRSICDQNESTVDSSKPLNGLKILDVGCGGGFLCEPLVRLGANVTGLDASNYVIDVANEHKKLDNDLSQKLNYVCCSIEEYSLDNKEVFDVIVSSEVIEHVTNKKDFLKSTVDCLKPMGSIFITTMSQTFACNLVNIFIAENILGMIEKGMHQIDKCITPENLQALLEEYNCTTKRVHGFILNPFTLKWHWIPSTDLSYALHAVKN